MNQLQHTWSLNPHRPSGVLPVIEFALNSSPVSQERGLPDSHQYPPYPSSPTSRHRLLQYPLRSTHSRASLAWSVRPPLLALPLPCFLCLHACAPQPLPALRTVSWRNLHCVLRLLLTPFLWLSFAIRIRPKPWPPAAPAHTLRAAPPASAASFLLPTPWPSLFQTFGTAFISSHRPPPSFGTGLGALLPPSARPLSFLLRQPSAGRLPSSFSDALSCVPAAWLPGEGPA